MKTLKRTLALVLALVMCLGMFGNALAAPTYSDAGKISAAYAKAVEVLQGYGIMEGDAAGTFRPTDNIRRDESAKMIVSATIGRDQAEDLKGESTFTDVASGNWAQKYIKYGQDNNIIHGVGDNKYDPNSYVTHYEFVKMLVAALGYGTQGEFGANWKYNSSLFANMAGLGAGLNTTISNSYITREEAAQYMYNAINAVMVVYNTTSGTYHNRMSTGTSQTIDAAGVPILLLNNFGSIRTGEIWYKSGNYVVGNTVALSADVEEFGRIGEVYLDRSRTAVTRAFPTDTVIAELVADKAGPGSYPEYFTAAATKVGTLAETVDLIANGVKTTGFGTGASNAVKAAFNNSLTKDATKIIALDQVGDGEITRVLTLNSYADLVEGTTPYTVNKAGLLTINGVFNTADAIKASNVRGYEDLELSDVILLYPMFDSAFQFNDRVLDGSTIFIYKAEAIHGTNKSFHMVGTSRVWMNFEGMKLAPTGLKDYNYNTTALDWDGLEADLTGTVYLDRNGLLIHSVADADTAPELAYVLMIDIPKVITRTTQANLLFMDGTTDVVTIDLSAYINLDINDVGDLLDIIRLVWGFVTYEVDSKGIYTLTPVDPDMQFGPTTDVDLANRSATMLVDGNAIVVTDKTVIFHCDSVFSDVTVTTYGRATVPTTTGAYGAVYTVDGASATYVVYMGTPDPIPYFDVFITDVSGHDRDGDGINIYQAFVNGVETEVKVTKLDNITSRPGIRNNLEVGLYSAKLTADGTIELVDDKVYYEDTDITVIGDVMTIADYAVNLQIPASANIYVVTEDDDDVLIVDPIALSDLVAPNNPLWTAAVSLYVTYDDAGAVANVYILSQVGQDFAGGEISIP